jgi:hypothetical protein
MFSSGSTSRITNMKNINIAINEVEYQLHQMVKKAIRDNHDSIGINTHHLRALLEYMQLAKSELEEINADQNPADYNPIAA